MIKLIQDALSPKFLVVSTFSHKSETNFQAGLLTPGSSDNYAFPSS